MPRKTTEELIRKYHEMSLEENRLRDKGYRLIAGLDEVGRGPLAGPVVTAAVILPPDSELVIPGVDDSKKLTAKRREALYEEITAQAIAWSIGIMDVDTIDRVNILQATRLAMEQAVGRLQPQPEVLIIDALELHGVTIPQMPLIHGDALSVSVAAASIVAKVTRDRMMEELDKIYPEYGFASNKGYGSAAHIAALKEHGPCPVHRRTFIGHFVNP
ncbi:MAG: ribonuclease HII [Firmicutes bacterium]|nr:ribonuclease HII [Bacillota bacterium]